MQEEALVLRTVRPPGQRREPVQRLQQARPKHESKCYATRPQTLHRKLIIFNGNELIKFLKIQVRKMKHVQFKVASCRPHYSRLVGSNSIRLHFVN